MKEYYPNVWINTGQPICSIDSSNSRYQEGVASGAKNEPRRVKAGTMCVAHRSKANMNKVMHVAWSTKQKEKSFKTEELFANITYY